MAIGHLSGVEVRANATWEVGNVQRRFTLSSQGTSDVASVYQADTEPVPRSRTQWSGTSRNAAHQCGAVADEEFRTVEGK